MTCTHHNPLHCVVPPYMLEKLASKGKSANAREKALKSLRVSRYFRSTRREAQDVFQAMGFRCHCRRRSHGRSRQADQKSL